MRIFLAACALVLFLAPHALYAQSTPASERPIAGLGHAHMDTSCSPGVSADFDRALALLHNFWYARALEAFREVEVGRDSRSEEHTSELQSRLHLVCRLLLEKKKNEV